MVIAALWSILAVVTFGYIDQLDMYCTFFTTMLFGFSACGSILFTFGSVLLWAVMRNILPDNKYLAVAAGLASGVTVTAVAKEYLDFVDSKV